MFFLIRSAVCIGTVAVLAAAGGDKAGMGRVFDSGGREAVQNLGRACVASNDCLRLGMSVVAAVSGSGHAGRLMPTDRSTDTLNASDLLPAWGAPRGRRVDLATHLHPATLARL